MSSETGHVTMTTAPASTESCLASGLNLFDSLIVSTDVACLTKSCIISANTGELKSGFLDFVLRSNRCLCAAQACSNAAH